MGAFALEGRFVQGKKTSQAWAATLGNFDGVHRGHQNLIESLVDKAGEKKALPAVFTFQPHPLQVLKQKSPAWIYPAEKKYQLLAEYGIEVIFEIHPTAELLSLAAADFLQQVFLPFHPLAFFLVGDEFCFGKDRQGTTAVLKTEIAAWNLTHPQQTELGVLAIDQQEKKRFSSSKVRKLLAEDKAFEQAAAILGRWWSVEGEVVGGKKLGRTLEVPTANLRFERSLPLAYGVYAAKARLSNGATYGAAMNFGVRPTVETGSLEPLMEVHLLDFQADLYGSLLEVTPLAYLRSEQKFSGLEALKLAISQDILYARKVWNQFQPYFV